MKADKYRRITIPAYIVRKSEIKGFEELAIVKGKGYGKFYLTSCDGKETWKVISHFEHGTKMRLPKEIYFPSAEYKVFLEDRKVCIQILKTA